MSVNVDKGKEVIVVTIKADSKSMFPPLCQILGALCYSPMLCTVHKGLKQTTGTAALGTIQILVGLFNIGLGPGRTSTHPEDFTDLGAAYWLGTLFILAGITSLIAAQHPFICLVGFTAFVNIVTAIFSIVGIVLYAIDLGDSSVSWMCNQSWGSDTNYGGNCVIVAYFAQKLLIGMDITLIVLAVLQLCVCISLAVLCIRALVGRGKVEVKEDFYQPMVEEVVISPAA